MYIAFKWLTGLALAMWLAMCFIDFYVKYSKEIIKKGLEQEANLFIFRNTSLPLEADSDISDAKKMYAKKYDTAVLHYTMFFAGAIAVSVFNKKREIISYTKITIAKINLYSVVQVMKNYLKETAILLCAATAKYSSSVWVILQTLAFKLKTFKREENTNPTDKHKQLNLNLIEKLKEIGEERRKLGHLLIAAINENKNIKMQFQLENMAKNRLVSQIEETQKKIKENRSKYISFQHLYLVTHQENTFLNARIRKVTKEKDDIEKDLMTIINRVYQSNNNDLKFFCSQFIVRPVDNFLMSDMCAEVQKFLRKSCHSPAVTSTSEAPSRPKIQYEDLNHYPYYPSNTCITEVLQDGSSLIPLVCDAPKLKGLPGEIIWTVKDKDGIIEKLYEYDYETDFDNGDTIRRIREYSVYHDKDCLLDFSSSRTAVPEPVQPTYRSLYPTSVRFLTGSEAFQKFLLNNKNIVPRAKSSTPSLLCSQATSLLECMGEDFYSNMEKLKDIDINAIKWKSIDHDGLNLDYAVAIPGIIADSFLAELEETLEYFSGDLAQIKVFGKIHPLPRQQVAYGDPGITYTYSGTKVPALPWPPPVLALRDFLFTLKAVKFDFVLVNKYRNGNDHMGEHRDNEPELDPNCPIASISFGQERDFVLKHKDARKPGKDRKQIPTVKLNLEHGSVLFMNPPTNDVWYHSLPVRKKAFGLRINFTFRKMRTITNRT